MLILVSLLAAATGCGTAAESGPDRATTAPVLHRGTGTVLQSPGHGPELCLGGMDMSLPPQCGGVPLQGWDWTQVDGEESVNGTTWGSYTVTGRYDGASLTLSAPPTAPASSDLGPAPPAPFHTPCAPPDGGWQVVGTGPTGEAGVQAVQGVARDKPDFAGLWIDQPPPGDDPEAAPPPPEQQVLNVAFTGDLERHEAELRRLWSGPLCVSQLRHTYAELVAIQQELIPTLAEQLGLQPLFSSVLETRNVVELGVVAMTPLQEAAVRERYGDTVEVTAGLQAVD